MLPAEKRIEGGGFRAIHDIDAEVVLGTVKQLEPYTTGESNDKLGIPLRTVYKFLETLYRSNRIRKKELEPQREIWIRGG